MKTDLLRSAPCCGRSMKAFNLLLRLSSAVLCCVNVKNLLNYVILVAKCSDNMCWRERNTEAG